MSPMEALTSSLGKGSLRKVRGADGAVFIELYPGGPMIPYDSDLGSDCAIYGPHGNCSRRDSDLSPVDVQSVAEAYTDESVPATALTKLPGVADWYYVALGALGVSHVFCLLEATVTQIVAGGPNVNVVPTALGVAGSRLVCTTPVLTGPATIAYAEGTYQWASDRPCKAKPGWDITTGRCRCEPPPCAATPSGTAGGGQEFFLFHLPGFVAGDTLVASFRVSRCDWLLCVEPGICPLENRLPFSRFTALPTRRVTPGIIRPYV